MCCNGVPVGILSDFCVADRSEAAAIAATTERTRWPSLESKGFTQLEVGLLHFALTGEDPNAPVSPPRFVKSPFSGKELPVVASVAYLDAFTCLDDREEAWVHEVPPSLVQEIAEAPELEGVAARWAENEELEGVEVGDLVDLLVELQRLARLARARGKSLLLWTSL